MKTKALEILIVVAILFVLAFVVGCKDEAEPTEGIKVIFPLKEGEPIPQIHHWGWGKVPAQNNCPHCGETSYTQFCTDCKKERGNLPFIGVYCPKCNPEGKYASRTDDVTEICGSCGSDKTWKYIYEDWQTEPNGITITFDGEVDYDWEPEPKEPEQVRVFLPHHRGCEHHGEFDAIYCPKCDGKPESTSSWVYIADPNEPKKISLDFIPTWPDYIELEKTLYVEYKTIGTHKWSFPKGTKIYFKEDEK